MKKFKLFIGVLFCIFVKTSFGQSDFKANIPIIASSKIGRSCMFIIDTAFLMPQLKRTREIKVYLPPAYGQSKKRFPVIYVQDGQKIEDSLDSNPMYILHRLDSLYALGKSQSIIVAIFSSVQYRDKEYDPSENGEGGNYLKFVAYTLKPFIDKNFKTISSKENTIIAGNGQGAVISLYATITMPSIFGKAGIFSPDVSNTALLKDLVSTLSTSFNNKLFFYNSNNESEEDLLLIEELTDNIGQNTSAMVYKMMDNLPGTKEAAWAKWFPEFTLWINADGYNYVIKPW